MGPYKWAIKLRKYPKSCANNILQSAPGTLTALQHIVCRAKQAEG